MSSAYSGKARLAVVVLTTMVGLVVSGVFAAPASAHAVLVSSSPTDGSRVDQEPAAVSLTFDEAVQPILASDQVIAGTGARVDTGQLRQSTDGATITMPLKPGLPKGSYTAVWRVVSADTHIVSGSITFGLGVDPAAAPVAQADATGGLDIAADVAEGLVYAGVVLLLGIAAAGSLWWPWVLARRRVRVAARAGWLLTVIGTAADLLLQGPRAADVSWAGVVRFTDFGQTLSGAFGWELVARLGLLVLMLPLLTRRWLSHLHRRDRAATSAVAGVALLLTVALTGHESVGGSVPLAMTSAMLHLASMTIWLGGLATLTFIVLPAATTANRHAPDQLTALSLRRWSATAYGCVACLVVTGEYQASRQLAPVQSLWSTTYGVVLLIKIGLVGLIVAAAALAQRRVRKLDPGEDRFAHGNALTVLRRSVRIEVALAVLVIAVTSVLVAEPPGNTTYGPPVSLAAPLGPDSVVIHVDSTVRGRQQFEVDILDAQGRPAPVQSVTANLSSAEVASLALKLQPDAPVTGGRSAAWRSAPIVVPDTGVWTVNLDVSIDDTDAYATVADYQVW